MAIQAIMTGVAGDMMSNGYPVAYLKPLDSIAYRNYFSRDFVSKHKRRLFDAVPFHDVTTADTACHYLYQQFAGTNVRGLHLFDSYVPVIVIHCHAHGIPSPEPILIFYFSPNYIFPLPALPLHFHG